MTLLTVFQRYGWHGFDNLLQKSFDVAAVKYPWLNDYRERAVTELEFLHGHLRNPGKRAACFFFRDKVGMRFLIIKKAMMKIKFKNLQVSILVWTWHLNYEPFLINEDIYSWVIRNAVNRMNCCFLLQIRGFVVTQINFRSIMANIRFALYLSRQVQR